MSKPANKTMIGAFVLGAVVLAVVAIVIFGSGRFFKDTSRWFCYFEGSVKGLNVGSPVVFRGVQVGEVTDIIVNFDSTKMQAYIPVFFETYPDKFREIGPEVVVSESAFHHALVSKGLRAQLQMQSLVTGQLVINVDFLPDTPAKLQGVQLAGPGKKLESWWEIPTIPTPLQRLESALAEISFKEIAEDVRRAMDGIAKLATSPDLHASIGELRQTMTDVQKLVRNIDSKIEPLATGIDQTLVEAKAGIGDARKLITNIDKQTTPLISRIQKATDSVKIALEQADTTLKSIENLAEEGSKLRYEVSTALREVGAASRSVRVLADFIEQHPDAILRGRANQTGGQ